MKAEHRHELKTNELAEWLNNFPSWAKQNATRITCVIVAAAIIGGVVLYYWYGKNVEAVREQVRFTALLSRLASKSEQISRAQLAGMDTSSDLLVLAGDFGAFAQKVDKEEMAALALIKQAQALRMELHYRPGVVSEQELLSQIQQAMAAYSEAVIRASNSPSLMALAKLGLGLCEEELGNFGRAREIYRQISETAVFEPTVAFVQAKQRLATMDDYKKAVFFVEPPAKPPAVEVVPQIPVGSDIIGAEPIVQIPVDSNLVAPESAPPVAQPKAADSNAAPNSVPSE